MKPNTTLYFPVVQECEQGVSRWIDIPAKARGHSHDEQVAGAGRQADAETVRTAMRLIAGLATLLWRSVLPLARSRMPR